MRRLGEIEKDLINASVAGDDGRVLELVREKVSLENKVIPEINQSLKVLFWVYAKEFVDLTYAKMASDEIITDCIFTAFSQVLDNDEIKKEFLCLPDDNDELDMIFDIIDENKAVSKAINDNKADNPPPSGEKE